MEFGLAESCQERGNINPPPSTTGREQHYRQRQSETSNSTKLQLESVSFRVPSLFLTRFQHFPGYPKDMDPFSIASGVAGLVGLAQIVVEKGFAYIGAAKDSREDIRNLICEVATWGSCVPLKLTFGADRI